MSTLTVRLPTALPDSFEDTLVPDAPPRDEGAPLAASSRTTVLPRVELVGDRPHLIADARTRFEVVGTLGAGGAGEVLAVADHDIRRRVAVKKLRGRQPPPESILRFVEEIRTVGALEHPNIVPIHDVGVDEDGGYYFVMKLVDGETLEFIVRKLAEGDPEYHRRYGFERRVQIFRGILEAVAFAHARGIVHRDLKPANVMIGPFGEVLVMDWGVARRVQAHAAGGTVEAAVPATDDDAETGWRTQAGAVVGTPAYMSPEQARGRPVDERSEVYSLCVLFHELLTLKHYLADKKTLTATLVGVLNESPRFMDRGSVPRQPPAPMDLLWFARDGLHKEPAQRYPSVAAMIERLDRRAAGDIPIQCRVTCVKRIGHRALTLIDRHPLAFTVGLGLMALGLIGSVALHFLR